MPIDPRIALGYQAPQIESPVNMMMMAQKMQAGQQENALRQAQMENYQAEATRRNALLPHDIAKAQSDAETAALAQQEKTFEIANNRYKIFQQVTGALASKPNVTKDDAIAAARGLVTIGMLDQDKADAMLGQLPDEPFALQAALKQSAIQQLTPEQMFTLFAPKPTATNAGDKTVYTDTNPNSPTYMKLVGEVRHTLSPDEAARLKQAETSGEWSPESVEFAAQIVANGGAMPQVGMGKNAIGIRDQILKRASELTGGAGGAGALANKQTRASEAATLRAFSSGLEGRKVTAMNTAINHLETMDKLANALANPSDVQAFNAAASEYAKQTGATAPTNFDAAKQIVAAEVIKAVVQNGGGVKERQEAAEKFSRANTTEQLKGVINSYRDLLGGQLQSLKLQYETGTNRTDFDKRLTPNTRKLLSQSLESAAPTPGAAPVSTPPNIQSLLDKYKTPTVSK